MRMRCVVVTVLAAGCGGSSPTSGGGSGNPPAPTATVSMSEYRFAPETLRVAVGSVVGCPPPQTCPYPPCDGTPGGTFTFTFQTAGTYPYHCMFHESLGMKGVVIVTP